MKFSVTKEKLLEGLQQVQNVVSTRTTLPILSNVLLQADKDEIHLTTTDLDVGVRGSCEAHVDKAGATTLPARRLFNIVRELPSSEIQVDVDGKNAASIRGGQSFFKILGLPEDEFPPLPKFEDAKVVTIRQKDLRDGLRKTSYAISTDETRYVLNGVLFSFKDNKLTLVATDGRRLAMAEIELEFPRSHETDLIIPTKAVTESLAVAYKGRDFSIAFNPEFLMAPLRALLEDEVFLDLIDEMSPGVLKIQTPFLYVLMPMRISS